MMTNRLRRGQQELATVTRLGTRGNDLGLPFAELIKARSSTPSTGRTHDRTQPASAANKSLANTGAVHT